MNASFLDLRKHVETLRDGRKLHDIVGLILQLLIVLAGVSLIGTWWRSWTPQAGLEIGFFGWVALVVWQVAWPLAVFLALQALFLRALEIRKLPSGRYTVAPMVELVLRGIGEAAMAALLVMAVPAMLVVWCNGFPLVLHLLPSLPNLAACLLRASDGPRFWSGISTLVALPAQGLVALIGSYFVAEAVIALFAIAEDVGELRHHRAEATPEDHG